MEKAILLKITGRVQGVFYRAETKRKADELGLTGWVRNLDDGSVEVFAQGEEEALKKLEKWCWEGPEASEVVNVTKEQRKAEQCNEFIIQ